MKTLCEIISKDTVLLNILSIQSEPFNGIFEDHTSREQFSNINNLIFSFYLFEFGYKCSEDFTTNIINKSLEYIQQTNILPNLKNVYFLYNTAPINLDFISNKYTLKKIYLNYFLLRSYFTRTYCNSAIKKWDTKNPKALFLIGQPFKLNRLPILYSFYQRKKMSLIDYSLNSIYYKDDPLNVNINPNIIDEYSRLLFNGCSQKLIDFLGKMDKKIDDDFIETSKVFKTNSIFQKSAYIIPDEWFDASLILCMETYFYDLPSVSNIEYNIFSEKFWKTVLSKKPFIMSSYDDHYYDKLEKLGFKNFLKYTTSEKKMYTGSMSSRKMDKNLLEKYSSTAFFRTTSFLNNMEKQKVEIRNDIEYNYELWKHLAHAELQKLLSKCPPLNNIQLLHLNELFLMNPAVSVLSKKV